MNLESIVGAFAYRGLKDILKRFFTNHEKFHLKAIDERLAFHHTEVVNWSLTIDFLGLSTPKSTNQESIGLCYSTTFRRTHDKYKRIVTEADLLGVRGNLLITGDPGAGKTTTLKRLLQTFYNNDINRSEKVVVLIRLKELSKIGLYEKIIETIGLSVGNLDSSETKHMMQSIVPLLLDKIGVLLVLDGYDELPLSQEESIRQEIVELADRSVNYKLILTTRFGTKVTRLEKFITYEIQPLTMDQIGKISLLWCTDPELFLRELKSRTYFEIANRPLFLNYLILIHNRTDDLPVESAEIIKQILYLIIHQWNEYNNVKRKSQFSNFHVTKQQEFLSHIAYFLIYEAGSKRAFTEVDLQAVFLKIHLHYGLKREELRIVLDELESLTGLISRMNEFNFEFTHSVLQEYLAADYLVKLPIHSNTREDFQMESAPFALATKLSSDPSLYMYHLFLNSSHFIESPPKRDTISIYVRRLLTERVHFTNRVELGWTVGYLNFLYGSELVELNELNMMENVLNALQDCKVWYKKEKGSRTRTGLNIYKLIETIDVGSQTLPKYIAEFKELRLSK